MFEHDRSAARGEMIVRGLYDFEHVGTQHENNAEQNKREARLGCAHAHKLIEGIKVDLSDAAKAAGKTFPESFADYAVTNTWATTPLPKGIKLHLRHEIQASALTIAAQLDYLSSWAHLSVMSTTLTIGEFKARLPEALALVQKGEFVTVTYGRGKRPVAVFGPPPRAPRRKLGHLAGKFSVTIHPDFKMTEEEFLGA
jgi:antitoxin (DNA-binding transcriptional repressor) of toxin-antitoxin stability system